MQKPILERILDRVVDSYGPGQIVSVEQLGERLFRVRLTGGRVVSAELRPEGAVAMTEQEAWNDG